MYFTIEPRSGGYRAYLKGGNNKVIWWTETYVRKSDAEHAISLAQQANFSTQVYDLT